MSGMKKNGQRMKPWLPAVRRKLRQAIYDFHVRAFGEEMARVNFLPAAQRRRYIAEMMDHATRKGVKFDKRALGVTP
jgi:chemotaxis regulatin CheY-phosphate phosphatase CheZ